tara:strand:- start:288 stop:521 length:234 start_codon:yes stop_codon:yes gene_type:complete
MAKINIKKAVHPPKTESIIAVMTSGIKKDDLVQQSYGWARAEEDSYKDANGVFCVKLSTRLVKFMSKDQPIQVKRSN